MERFLFPVGWTVCLGLWGLGLSACGDDTTAPPAADMGSVADLAALDGPQADMAVPPAEGCNPLAPEWDCLFPFPSDVFLREGRVVIPEPARVIIGEEPADLLALHPADGFSIAAPIMAVFPAGIDDSELTGAFDDLSRTTELDSRTLIVDTSSGELVPHFAELDIFDEDVGTAGQTLLIRPAVPLAYGHRYVVAIHGLEARGGGLLEAPIGFAAMRDNGDIPDRLTALAARYDEDVFGALESLGVARSELQLAWDFTARSRDNTVGDMLAVRSDLLARLQEEPPAARVVEVIDSPAELGELATHIARQIEVTIEVPHYLTSTMAAMGRLRLGSNGEPLAEGREEFQVTILVPKSVASRSEPAPFLQMGHGFFGRRTEILNPTYAQFANEHGFILAAIDWWGMFAPDQDSVAVPLVTDGADLAEMLSFTDRLHQGMANQIALAMAARTTLPALPELANEQSAPALTEGGERFWGISQGHILGGTYAALSPFADKIALTNGGANFSLIMYRSLAFAAFRLLINVRVAAGVARQKFAALLQMTLDRIDPLSYAGFVLDGSLESSPPDRRVLMQAGIGDAAVPAVSAQLHARAIGLPLLQPARREWCGGCLR